VTDEFRQVLDPCGKLGSRGRVALLNIGENLVEIGEGFRG
jgi:hypothetical protein